MKQLPPPLVPVAVERGLRPPLSVKAHGFATRMSAGPVSVGVVESQAKALRERQRRHVLRIDELGVLFDDLPVFEGSTQRPDPAAGNRVVLVDLRLDAVLGPKPVSTAQPGDSRSHDHHSRRGRGTPRQYRARRQACASDRPGGGAQKRPPAYRARQQLLRLVQPTPGLAGEARDRLCPANRRRRAGAPPGSPRRS